MNGELFEAPAAGPVPDLPPGDPRALLRRQFGVLGFLCSGHPLELFVGALARSGRIRVAELSRHVGQRVRVAGWLIAGKVVPTRLGDAMEFITFEDETDLVETTFFPRAYRRFCDLLDPGRPFLLGGRVEEELGALTLTVDTVERLSG